MKDRKTKLKALKKLIREDKQEIIEFCKNVKGYDGITDFKLDGILSGREKDDVSADTLYILDNLGYLNMIVLSPAITYEEYKKHHLSNYEYLYGYKMETRKGYYITLVEKEE